MKHPSVWKCYQSQVPKSFPSRLPEGDCIDEQKTSQRLVWDRVEAPEQPR